MLLAQAQAPQGSEQRTHGILERAARLPVTATKCLQVKFVYEAFRKLRPGVPLAMLHGSMKQMKRFAVFYTFSQSEAMILFATDIAARGLDFPRVDWVVQADCPEDADAYIHRVGRTARFTSCAQLPAPSTYLVFS